MTNTTPTTPTVVDAATQEEALPLSGLSLIGTVLSPKGARAFLRRSIGGVKQVQTGDRVSGYTIVAINEGSVILAKGEDSQTLGIPGQ